MTTTTTDLPDLAAQAAKTAERFTTVLEQAQQLSLDSAKTWARALSTMPVAELPTVSLPTVTEQPSVGALASYPFELASHLLKAQRDVTRHLVGAMAGHTAR